MHSPLTISRRSLTAVVLPALAALLAITADFSANTLSAQESAPARLLSVFPAGGQAGQTVKVNLAGTDIDDATGLIFDHPGIKSEAIMVTPPPPKPDPKTKKAPEGPPPTPKPDPRNWLVKIAGDVPAGLYEVRVVTADGLTNPRAFAVGHRPEVLETAATTAAKPLVLEPESVAQGKLSAPREVDWFRVKLAKGRRYVIRAESASIDSLLAPALEVFGSPNDLTADGRPASKPLQVSAYYSGPRTPMALLDFTPPADGEYLLRLHDYEYQGTPNDHTYRLSVSTAPQVEFAIPAAVTVGKPTPVTLYGRNLPGGKPTPSVTINGQPLEQLTVTVTAPADALTRPLTAARVRLGVDTLGVSAFEYRLGDKPDAEPILLGATADPVSVEAEPNDASDKPQAVTLPLDLTGSFGVPGDQDFYAFDAKKGESWRIEATAARLGSRSDPVVLLGRLDPAAPDKPSYLMDNVDDDTTATLGLKGPGNRSKLEIRSEDPRLLWTVPADGRYFVQLQDRAGARNLGGRYFYRLSITKPTPSFQAVVSDPEDVPTGGTVLRQGGRTSMQVQLTRLDGFDGQVTISATGLPAGVTAEPVLMGPGSLQAPLVFSASEKAAEWTGSITVTASATINGKTVTTPVLGALIVTGNARDNNQTAPIARLTRDVVLAVRSNAIFELSVEPREVSALPGDKIAIKVKLARRGGFGEAVALTLYNTALIPDNNVKPPAVGNIDKGKDAIDGTVTIDRKSPFGDYTYALLGSTTLPATKPPAGSNAKARPKPVKVAETSNTFTVHVVPPFELQPAKGDLTLVAGGEVTLLVRVERAKLPSADGDITLTLKGLPNTVNAVPVVVKKGSDEAKLVIKTGPKTAAATLTGLTVEGRMTVNGAAMDVAAEVPATLKVEPAPAAPPKK